MPKAVVGEVYTRFHRNRRHLGNSEYEQRKASCSGRMSNHYTSRKGKKMSHKDSVTQYTGIKEGLHVCLVSLALYFRTGGAKQLHIQRASALPCLVCLSRVRNFLRQLRAGIKAFNRYLTYMGLKLTEWLVLRTRELCSLKEA